MKSTDSQTNYTKESAPVRHGTLNQGKRVHEVSDGENTSDNEALHLVSNSKDGKAYRVRMREFGTSTQASALLIQIR